MAISLRMDVLSMAARAFPIGAGVLAGLVFLASWAGVPYTRSSLLFLSSLLVISMATIIYIRRKHSSRTVIRPKSKRIYQYAKPHLPILLIAAVALAILSWLSVGRAYSSWDAIVIWGLNAIGFAEQGTIMRPIGAYGLSYPINLPLQISFFRLLSGDLAPGSKLLFPFYYISLVLGTYAFLQKRSNWKIGLVGALLLGTIPIVVEHATIGYANLPFTVYLVLGLISIMLGFDEKDTGEQLVGGILLGFASWTRPEGAFLFLPMLVVIYLGVRVIGYQGRSSARAWLLPPLLFIVVWQFFMATVGAQGFFGGVLRIAWESIRTGQLNLLAFYWTARYALRQLIDPRVWGLIAPITLLSMILRGRRLLSKEESSFLFLLLPAAVGGLSLFAYYYLASFRQDIHYLLGTSVNRLFMPVWILGFIGILHIDFRTRKDIES